MSEISFGARNSLTSQGESFCMELNC